MVLPDVPLQGLVVEQPVQLCPLCGGVAVLVYSFQEVGYCLSWRSALALPVHPSPLAFRSCSLAVIIVYYGLLYMSIGTLYKVYRMLLVNFIL